MEGRKEVLWIVNKESFGQKQGFWFVKMVIFADSEERYVQKKFLYIKMALSEVRKVFYKWKTFGWRKRAVFSAHAKPTDKEKHFSAYNDTNFLPH